MTPCRSNPVAVVSLCTPSKRSCAPTPNDRRSVPPASFHILSEFLPSSPFAVECRWILDAISPPCEKHFSLLLLLPFPPFSYSPAESLCSSVFPPPSKVNPIVHPFTSLSLFSGIFSVANPMRVCTRVFLRIPNTLSSPASPTVAAHADESDTPSLCFLVAGWTLLYVGFLADNPPPADTALPYFSSGWQGDLFPCLFAFQAPGEEQGTDPHFAKYLLSSYIFAVLRVGNGSYSSPPTYFLPSIMQETKKVPSKGPPWVSSHCSPLVLWSSL